MQFRRIPSALVPHLLRRCLGDVPRYWYDGTPGRVRQTLHLASTLKIIQVVPCLRDAGRQHQHPVVFHEHDVGIACAGGDAVAFQFVQRKAIIGAVHDGTAIKLQRCLAGPDQRIAIHHAEGRGVGHMGVEDGTGARQPCMYPGMDKKCCVFRYAVARDDRAMEVANKQPGCGDLGKGPAVGIDQEQVVAAGHHE